MVFTIIYFSYFSIYVENHNQYFQNNDMTEQGSQTLNST